jgi:hypothetical protein
MGTSICRRIRANAVVLIDGHVALGGRALEPSTLYYLGSAAKS